MNNVKHLKLTLFILLLPVVMFFSGALVANYTHIPMLEVFLPLYLGSSVACLLWGVYISSRSRVLGWLCVLVGVAPLILMLLPVASHGATKIHA